MEVEQREFRYSGTRNRVSAGNVHVPAGDSRLPVVVLCHGFKGFKDWGFMPALAEAIAAQGYAALRFNFSHNGCSPDGAEESDLDAFRENRLTYEVADLSLILERVRSHEVPYAPRMNPDRMVVVGHSRGGSAVIRCAEEEGVRGIGLLASISRPPAVAPDEAREWQKTGVSHVENKRTGTMLPLGLGLLAELLDDEKTLERKMRALRKPVCIIHGENDQTVPVSAAHELASWAKGAELHILPGGDHTFGVRHPFSGWTPQLESVRDLLLGFFGKVFSSSRQ